MQLQSLISLVFRLPNWNRKQYDSTLKQILRIKAADNRIVYIMSHQKEQN